MIRSYSIIAFRNLRKHKAYSALNLTGLAVGLATTMLILLWVKDEMSYDRFHGNHRQIHRVLLNVWVSSQETQTYQYVVPILAAAMQDNVPGVRLASRCSGGEQALFTYQDKHIEEKGHSVDANFLQIFNFPLVKGSKHTALTEPNTLLITERLAEKYFGEEEPLGKTIRIDQTGNYKVVGVLADVPSNSSLQFDYLRPATATAAGSWMDNTDYVFVELDEHASPDQVQKQLEALTQRHLPGGVKDREYFLHPLDDWYLRTDFKNGQYAGGGRITYVRLFGMIALLVLAIACINFMNLSTARAAQRAKEVGVRKAVGADKQMLVGQFLGESLLFTSLAGIIALGIVALVLPAFNEVFQKRIALQWGNLQYLAGLATVLLLTGLLAGMYPAFVLSSFRPEKVLKGHRQQAAGGVVWFRKLLVLVQFTASIILLIGTGIVYQQIRFIQQRNIGYQKENLLWFSARGLASFPRYALAKAQLASIPGVEAIAGANSSFQGSYGRNYATWRDGQNEEKAMFAIIHGDYELVPTLRLQLQSGRNFSASFATDSSNFIINQAAVRQMNLANPIGQMIKVNDVPGKIIGVVKDFHIASVHQEIEPVVIACRPNGASLFFVRLKGQNVQQAVSLLANQYNALLPGQPFSYHFVDQAYEKMYRSELQIGTLAKGFSLLAIFVSCLGLFGLASFSVERRAKEIGVRKVLGASLGHIFTIISREFLLPVILALLLAVLPAWYLMNEWLEKFYYRIEISGWVFILAGLLALCVALLTVGFQSIKAALANPVKSLRSE
jgi:ABC-type antimicrobial peptide transport system permease subunit